MAFLFLDFNSLASLDLIFSPLLLLSMLTIFLEMEIILGGGGWKTFFGLTTMTDTASLLTGAGVGCFAGSGGGCKTGL